MEEYLNKYKKLMEQYNVIQKEISELEKELQSLADKMHNLRIKYAKILADNINKELSDLENTLTEPYELQEINVSTFCEQVMEQIKGKVAEEHRTDEHQPEGNVKALHGRTGYDLHLPLLGQRRQSAPHRIVLCKTTDINKTADQPFQAVNARDQREEKDQIRTVVADVDDNAVDNIAEIFR